MKSFPQWTRPAASLPAYLDRLGKKLVSSLPASQVREVLTDYRERFEAGREQGRSDAELLKALGSPEDAAARFLEENPPSGVLRHNLLWGAMLALCFLFLQYFVFLAYSRLTGFLCGGLFVCMTAGVLFVLLRGGSRAELERQFPPERSAPSSLLLGLPLAAAVVFEAALQLLVANAAALAEVLPPYRLGLLVQLACFTLAGLMALLALWWTVRSVTASIRYFPGAVHALGLAVAGLTSLMPFLSMDLSRPLPLALELLTALLLPYLTGLAAALALGKWIDTQFPACFRQRGGGRQDYLDRLGKCLLRWYPAGQVREILSDYREQFELGLERGKSESVLVEELGRPETVARDLLAADSPLLRRAARRRTLLWAVPLILAVYCLVGMFVRFEYGYRWRFLPEAAPVFLALGAVSLFALLHGAGRSEVEAAFPPERGKPPVWLHPALLVLEALAVAGLWHLLARLPLQAHSDWNLGLLLASLLELPILLLGALLVWTVSQSFTRSIRYFFVSLHTVGVILSLLAAGECLVHLDPTCGYALTPVEIAQFLLQALSPYLTALLLMAGFWAAARASAGRGREG